VPADQPPLPLRHSADVVLGHGDARDVAQVGRDHTSYGFFAPAPVLFGCYCSSQVRFTPCNRTPQQVRAAPTINDAKAWPPPTPPVVAQRDAYDYPLQDKWSRAKQETLGSSPQLLGRGDGAGRLGPHCHRLYRSQVRRGCCRPPLICPLHVIVVARLQVEALLGCSFGVALLVVKLE
jgi:hypothetical protein